MKSLPRPVPGVGVVGGYVSAASAAAAAAEVAAEAAAAAASAGSRNTRVSVKYRPFMDAWDKGFAFNAREERAGVWLQQVTEGAVPPELVGTYFRNGPGRFRRGPDTVRHPYDGDGLVAAVSFPGDGRAWLRSAFVKTLEWVTARACVFVRIVQIQCWGRGEIKGGLPYALDPSTLATLGPDTLDGALAPGLPLSLGSPAVDEAFGRVHRSFGANSTLPPAFTAPGGDALCAHPRLCSTTGRRVFWSSRVVARAGALLRPAAEQQDTQLTFWEEDAEEGPEAEAEAGAGRGPGAASASDMSGAAAGGVGSEQGRSAGGRLRLRYRVPGYCMVHDVAVTPSYYVLLQPPVHSEVRGVLGGAACGVGGRARVRSGLWIDHAALSGSRPSSPHHLTYQPPTHAVQPWPYILGEVCAFSSLRWRRDEPATLHVIPRPGSDAERCATTRPMHVSPPLRFIAFCIVALRPPRHRPLNSEPSRLRRRGEQPLCLPVSPASFVFHHVNAFEERRAPVAEAAGAEAEAGVACRGPAAEAGAGEQPAAVGEEDGLGAPGGPVSAPLAPPTLVLDSIHYESLPAVGAQPLPEQRLHDADAGFRPRLRRLEVDLAARTVTALAPAPAPAWYVEQPAFNGAFTGRRHRYVYGFSAIFEDAAAGLAKVDMDTHLCQRWSPGPGYICLEPTFVPRLPAGAGRGNVAAAVAGLPPAAVGRQRSEDDGWLLAYGYDSLRGVSELLVFDAWALMAGPVARLALPHPLPHGLHGAWSDHCFAPASA
ncbi:Apocarotenoid-15,15'-oxygenase [Tetrabaena socialis]|uniref:Apocarotenoid-15,15'-oxygenase n=1 Tax=Tetrabaena socialis TaxID=47790 RepID=A0A2J8A1C1_9CHLO|nr:Apocarotenoid-15,15'-oxygenase [Tetrabaena socialis]|eukprot:PNH06295.1 Apocarotenoid-15,15'-oxygenase [Tetrabaena socialis]